jgi:hypothetical protein
VAANLADAAGFAVAPDADAAGVLDEFHVAGTAFVASYQYNLAHKTKGKRC